MDAVVMGSWSCLRDQDYRMRLAAEETSGAPARQGQSAIHPAAVKYAIDVICAVSSLPLARTIAITGQNCFSIKYIISEIGPARKNSQYFCLAHALYNDISAETDRTSETNARSECSIPDEPSVHETNMCPPRLQTQSPAMRTEMYKA